MVAAVQGKFVGDFVLELAVVLELLGIAAALNGGIEFGLVDVGGVRASAGRFKEVEPDLVEDDPGFKYGVGIELAVVGQRTHQTGVQVLLGVVAVAFILAIDGIVQAFDPTADEGYNGFEERLVVGQIGPGPA